MYLPKRFALLLIGFSVIFSSCEDDEKDSMEPPEDNKKDDSKLNKPFDLEISFDHRVGDENLVFNDMRYENKASNNYEVTKLEYIVSRFRLHKKDGEVVEYDTAVYINAQRDETQSFVLKDVPYGSYEKITFIHGLDSATNQPNALPPTQDLNNMAWPEMLGGGYHYMRMNGNYDSAGSNDVFTTHTGHTKGQDGKIHENFVEVTLQEFKDDFFDQNTSTITIAMDLNKWYQDPHTYNFAELEKEGIMGNQQIQQKLEENGQNVYSVKNVLVN